MENVATVQPNVESDSAQRARRGLATYFALLVAASALIEGIMIVSGHFGRWVLLLMCIPALASVITRIVLREGFGDVSFRIGGRRGVKAILLALIAPIVVGSMAYGIAWLTGLAEFTPPASSAFPAVADPAGRFGLQLISVFGINFVFGLFFGAGEEIGWRGYMLTRLIDARVPQPILVSGLIWGAWHLPLILGGLYAVGPSPLLAVLWFMVGVTVLTFLISQLRLSSGSIWPAVVLHTVWDLIIIYVFDVSTNGAQATLWVGVSGILVMLTLLAVVPLLARVLRPASESAT